VLTLNVQKGTPARKIARDVAAAGADIVCLQELDQGTKRSGGEDQIALLREALGVRGAYAPSYRDDGGTTGMAILSRFPVEDAVPVKLAGSRDIGLGATVKLPGATVTVFSVHLSATYKFDLGHLAETREMRRRETARLVELVDGTKGPVILAGDLNCALDPDLAAEFAKHLTDATAGVQATYPATAPVAKIDYVFARGLEAVGSQAMPEGSSDHRAVRCELRLQD
jgi:vancomycin resistance protein VanJ